MKRVLKILAFIVLGAASLAVLLAIAIRVLLPPEKARELIERQIASRLHREVKLGAVSIGLVKGLSVTGMSISERPTFAAGTFVSSDELRLRVALLPLLAKKIVVNDVRLVKPSVHIVRFADGRFNFSDLSAATTGQAAAPAPASGPDVLVTGVSLRDGTLTFDDRSDSAQSLTLDALNASISGFSLTGSADLDLAAGLHKDGADANLSLAGSMNFLEHSAVVKNLRVTHGEMVISSEGDVKDTDKEPTFSLKTKIQSLDLALLARLAPALQPYHPAGSASGSATLSGRQQDIGFDVSLDFRDAVFASTEGFSKRKDQKMIVAASGHLERMSTLRLDPLSMSLGSIHANVTGRVDAVMFSTRTMSLTLRTDPFPVSEALALLPKGSLPADVHLDGDVALNAKVNGTADDGALDLQFDGTALSLRYADSFHKPAGVPLTVHAEGRYATPTALTFRRLETTLAKATFTGDASYRSGPPSSWTASLGGSAFSVADLAALSPPARDYAPVGTASLKFDARGGKDPMTVRGTFTLKDGAGRYEASALSNVSTAGAFTLDGVSIPSLKGKLNGSDLTMKLSAAGLGAKPVIESDITVAELDMDKLLPKTPAAPKKTDASPWSPSRWALNFVSEAEAAALPSPPMTLTGTLKAARVKHAYFDGKNLDLAWKLTDVTPALDRVNGTARLRHGGGEFRNLQQLTADIPAARILFLPLALIQKLDKATKGVLNFPSTDRVPFSSINGDYSFKNGVMTVTSFLLSATPFNASLTGTIGLAGDQPVDAKAKVSLPPGAVRGTIGQLLVDADGRTTVFLAITGTVASPAARVDMKKAGQQMENLLKGLFQK